MKLQRFISSARTTGHQEALFIIVSQGPRLIKTPSLYSSTIVEAGEREFKPESAVKQSSLEVRKCYFSSQLISQNYVMWANPAMGGLGSSVLHMPR